jgi:hypothetical protein
MFGLARMLRMVRMNMNANEVRRTTSCRMRISGPFVIYSLGMKMKVEAVILHTGLKPGFPLPCSTPAR